MSGANPHHDRIDAELRYIGTVLEKIKLAKAHARIEMPPEIKNDYVQLNHHLDEATEKLLALSAAGPGTAEDLARTLDELVAELKATAHLTLARVDAVTAVS